MAEMVKKKAKTICCGKMYWVKGIVEPEGVLNELSGNMERSVTIRYPKDSEKANKMIAEIDKMWQEFLSLNPKIKQTEPKSLPYKFLDDSDEVEFRFKTNATFQDGKPSVIKVYNALGENVLELYREKGIQIGNESEGVVHGVYATYEYAKKFGITSYLKAIQISKLVEYSDDVELDDLSEYADDIETLEGNDSDIPF